MKRFLALLLLMAGPGCTPPPPPPTVSAGGPVQQLGEYTLYFGVIPAAVAGDAVGTHASQPRDAHGLPRGDYAHEQHLLVVAERTRDRVRPTNARVSASVLVDGQTLTRTLEPMPINGSMSYGAVFLIPNAGRYVFTTTVRVPDSPTPLVARFAYTQNHDPRP